MTQLSLSQYRLHWTVRLRCIQQEMIQRCCRAVGSHAKTEAPMAQSYSCDRENSG